MKAVVFLPVMVLLFSCAPKEIARNTGETAADGLDLGKTERELLIERITEFDTERRKFGDTINFLEKININTPGGDNWLVGWEDNDYPSASLKIYNIKEGSITRYNTGLILYDNTGFIEFDVMRDIPGRRILDFSAAFGDYNNDGYDEIVSLLFGGIRNVFEIIGYDAENDEIKKYFEGEFTVKDRQTGPPPVKFLTYNGIDGIQVWLDDGGYAFMFWNPDSQRFTGEK